MTTALLTEKLTREVAALDVLERPARLTPQPSPRVQPAAQPSRLAAANDAAQPVVVDIVDQWGWDSFPASDPPANW